uniref:Protein MCM10 homolog n=1 Tax=Nothobranchius korthausae TaxID=1143690 RepID=A0A1A8FBI2_9TELE
MQKQMQKLQQQLEASQKVPAAKTTTAASPKSEVLKPSPTQQPEPKRVRAKAIPTLMQSASTSSSTPSNSTGKTFSIWKLSDLHNLEVFVSLFLFGDVHKEHWKMEPGTVIGLLNPNSMKQRDGYDGVSLTVDHSQKVLVMGEAQDFGTCKAVKKNGEPCSQIVNMYECQYCQYHVKAQYKKMSSKRAELQSSYSGKPPNRAAEYQLQERYFDVLVKKEQMEEKMRGIREMKCRAVTCTKCNYTYFKPADRCVNENHALRWHDALKRFFKCPCGQRAIALDRLPHKHCSNCGLFKWERDGMLKEKTGPKIGGELLQPRGEEHAKFLNSMK